MSDVDTEYRNKHILAGPKYTVIEKTAAELAGTWYEIGREQGLKSKWKTPQAYARANFERFIPKAIEHLLTILGNPNISDTMKEPIYEALMERHNDKALNDFMPNIPNIDISKLLPKQDRIPDVLTQACKDTANPFGRKKGY